MATLYRVGIPRGLSLTGSAFSDGTGPATGNVLPSRFPGNRPLFTTSGNGSCVFPTGDADETFLVSAKTTTGFTVRSSDPGSTATVDWMLMR